MPAMMVVHPLVRHALSCLVVVLVSLLPPAHNAATASIEIELAEPTPTTLRAERVLRELLARYDLRAYAFTRQIRIKSGVIPHSHPVLTLNTRSLDDPERWLAQYLHEQIHWFLSAQEAATQQAIAAFRQRYPDLPTGRDQVARNAYSTYLHFAVNWLELKALRHYLGATRAEEILATQPFYRWIYATVIRDEAAIAEIMRRHNLVIDPEAD